MSWIKLQTGFEREGMAYARINIESHESDLNNALFDLLEGRKDDVEREFGEPLDWERRNNFPQSRIIARRSVTTNDSEEALEAT